MSETYDLRDPWLLAVWPGMGSIAFLAGSYLLQKLSVQRVAEIDASEFFEIQTVEVKNGVATLGGLPRNMFFEWRNPRGHRDLLIFVGEAQPATGGLALCQRVIEYAVQRGAHRLFTFAAMATQLQLGTSPKVFAAATDRASVAQVQALGAEVLGEGQISGLNGVLLGTGAQRGIHGTCLLGELPFFAVGLPNPRAAKAVLEIFTQLAGIDIDFSDLDQQIELVDQRLQQMIEQMTQSNDDDEESEDGDALASAEPNPRTEAPKPDARARRRIEALFEKAGQDRSKAFELKQELDRLGVFKQYEDRFLDLFRKAE